MIGHLLLEKLEFFFWQELTFVSFYIMSIGVEAICNTLVEVDGYERLLCRRAETIARSWWARLEPSTL